MQKIMKTLEKLYILLFFTHGSEYIVKQKNTLFVH